MVETNIMARNKLHVDKEINEKYIELLNILLIHIGSDIGMHTLWQ